MSIRPRELHMKRRDAGPRRVGLARERAASAFFLAEYLARFYSRGFDARRGPAYKKSSRGLMDKASPS